MVLSIKTDIPALISTRHFNRTKEGISASIGRLSSGFSDKSFQIRAYSGEKIGLPIGSASATKIGHMTTGEIVVHDGGEGIVYLPLELLSTMEMTDEVILDSGSQISEKDTSLILSGTWVGGKVETAFTEQVSKDGEMSIGQ